jgi:hypothetical protein
MLLLKHARAKPASLDGSKATASTHTPAVPQTLPLAAMSMNQGVGTERVSPEHCFSQLDVPRARPKKSDELVRLVLGVLLVR